MVDSITVNTADKLIHWCKSLCNNKPELSAEIMAIRNNAIRSIQHENHSNEYSAVCTAVHQINELIEAE